MKYAPPAPARTRSPITPARVGHVRSAQLRAGQVASLQMRAGQVRSQQLRG